MEHLTVSKLGKEYLKAVRYWGKGQKEELGRSVAELCAWEFCFLQGALLDFLSFLCFSQSPEAVAS